MKPLRNVPRGLFSVDWDNRMITIGRARWSLDTLLRVRSWTHCFIQLSGGRAGNLLHVVCRKPQLLLSSVVSSPPADNTQAHDKLLSMWRRPRGVTDTGSQHWGPLTSRPPAYPRWGWAPVWGNRARLPSELGSHTELWPYTETHGSKEHHQAFSIAACHRVFFRNNHRGC